MTASHDRLWVVRLPNDGGVITVVNEAKARGYHADIEGSTLSHRPFPSAVRMPFISSEDYSVLVEDGIYTATHRATGASGSSDDMSDAYRAMLRAVHDHLERETETQVS